MMHDDPLSGSDDAERDGPAQPSDAPGAPQGEHRAPPDPLDRLWRHPTEMGRRTVDRPARRRDGRQGVLFITSVAIGSSMVGAVLTVGILALSGLLNGRPHPTANDRLVRKATDDATAQAIASVRPSVVLVNVRDGNAARQGAGVVIRHGGDILTSAWLVGRAVEVTIETDDDRKMAAAVIGTDTASGLALLQADGDLPAATLAAHAPGVGKSVIALSGDGHAIGDGIVNATNVVVTDADGITIANAFATNARPPRDDAGAPVIDGRAQVAGILLPNGLGAVPIEYARAVADSIRTSGTVDHAWIGVWGVNSKYGPQVRKVATDGPAYLAGVERGDVIMTVNGRPVASAAELRADIRVHWPNQKLTIVVSRAGTSLPLDVTAGPLPVTPEPANYRPGTTTTTALASVGLAS